MGLMSLIAGMTGGGDVSAPNVTSTNRDYNQMLRGYEQGLPGLFKSAQTYLPKYAGLYQSMASDALPGAAGTMRNVNPELTALLDKILASASGTDLDYGGALPPKMLDLQRQLTRGGQAARGMGFGPSDVLGETRDATRLSMDLTDRNRAYAGNAAGLSYSMQSEPTQRFLGGIMDAGNNQLLSPANSLSLMLAPYQARMQANSESAKNFAGLIQSANSSFLGI